MNACDAPSAKPLEVLLGCRALRLLPFYQCTLLSGRWITVVAGGGKWYRMYEWWEIVVYFVRSMSKSVW